MDQIDPETFQGLQLPIDLHHGDLGVDRRTGAERDQQHRHEGRQFRHDKTHQQPSQVVGQPQVLDHLKGHAVDQGTEDHRHEKKQRQDLNRGEVELMDENHAGSAVVCPAVEKIEEDPGGKCKCAAQRRGCTHGGLADIANGLDHNANRLRRSRGMHSGSDG